MKEQQKDCFKSKFHLLNSQESSEEIIWSCSDSSDYENYSYNEINLKPGKRKRKQVKNKKNVANNTSNLDVTIVDGTKTINRKKTQKFSVCVKAGCKSPILATSQRFAPFTSNKSPVISLSSKENKQVSPVLVLKNSSQKSLPKVRKKLFEHNCIGIEKHRERSISPVLTCPENVLKKSKTSDNQKISISIKNNKHFSTDRTITNQVPNTNIPKNLPYEERDNINHLIKQGTQSLSSHRNQKDELQYLTQDADISIDTKIKSVALIDKVKSYFDNNFSSTSQSQHSISEYESKNSSKSNDDIEIINSLTEEKPQNVKLENRSDQSSDSLKSYNDIYVHKTKKIKYKKDGLEFRLNALLKKQNASNSLWYHERYLAANSNFIVPREDFIAFRIENVSFKFGCYLLNVLDINNEFCFVFINNSYIKSNTMTKDAIFKLYRPYKMLQFEKHKLYINVCKYECIVLKK